MLQQPGAPASLVDAVGWHRPRPQIMPPTAAEWRLPPPGPHMSLLHDSTLVLDSSATEAVRELLRKALSSPLLPSQQQALLALLDADPQLVHALQLQPQQLPLLVEHTPMLAYQILLRMLGSRQLAGLQQVLAHMPLSLHSMEVVNKLAASGCLPADMVHMYISNCINSCDDVPDRFMQNRLVRLVCVFLQSLIRHKVVSIAGLLLEVQAFCVRFGRIREAATLFRVLKQMEQGTSTSSSPVAGAQGAAQASGSNSGSPTRQALQRQQDEGGVAEPGKDVGSW